MSHAIRLGADRIVVLPTGFSCALLALPSTPIAAATHALTFLIEHRLLHQATGGPLPVHLTRLSLGDPGRVPV